MRMHVVMTAIPEGASTPRPKRAELQRRYSRLALRDAARFIGAPEERWSSRADGSPIACQGFFWSVTHARSMAAAVIARRPVGIDVERIVPRHVTNWDALASPPEWELLGGCELQSWYRLWTAKEAVLKSHGLGIGYLRDCRLASVDSDRSMTLLFRGETAEVVHVRQTDHILAVTALRREVEWHALSFASGAVQDMELPRA